MEPVITSPFRNVENESFDARGFSWGEAATLESSHRSRNGSKVLSVPLTVDVESTFHDEHGELETAGRAGFLI